VGKVDFKDNFSSDKRSEQLLEYNVTFIRDCSNCMAYETAVLLPRRYLRSIF